MYLKRKRQLAAKIEGTSGTAESLAAADAAFNVMNLTWTEDIPMNERMAMESLGQLAAVPGQWAAKVSFDVELAGTGSETPVPDWASVFLPACGMKLDTATFAFSSVTTDLKTITIGVYEDGVIKMVRGAAGTFTIDAEAGKFGTIHFDFTGVYDGIEDGSNIATVVYPNVVPPRVACSTITVGSVTPIISKISLASNNTVQLRQDISQCEALIAALITDRKPGGSLDPEQKLVATQDWWGNQTTGTEAALSLVLGTTGGNTITIAAPKLQVRTVGEADRNGIITLPISFQLNVDVGDDAPYDNELTITFS